VTVPFPSVKDQFQPGNPGGPGRPRKHPKKTRGTPWAHYRAAGADVEALAGQWAAMIDEGRSTAIVRMMALLARPRDEADARMLAALVGLVEGGTREIPGNRADVLRAAG
jgi:hypothetical protein